MDDSRRAPRYDLFKLIVAILLLILFFVLLRRPTSPPSATAPASASPTGAASAASITPSETPLANPVAVLATFPSPSLTASPIPASSPTQTIEPAATDALPSPTATNPEASNTTPLPSPTAETPVIQPTPTPSSEAPSTLTACEAAASGSRLQPGTTATIVHRLNFRSSPGIKDNWLRTNIPGTQVEIIGGPECLPHVTGAYIWWQIRLPNGEVGWSAEGSVYGTFYFMEPE